MATPRDWIKRSMRLIGAMATGETPSAEELSDGLSVLNAMLDTWSNQRFLIHARVREEFSLVAGTSSYTFGTGGTFNSARPLSVDRFGIIPVGEALEIPIEEVNQDDWALITTKTTQSSYPSKVFLTGSYPLQTVKVWPVPTTAATLVVYSKKPLSRFASASTTIELPEGYEEAVVYNLAKRLAPEYGKSLDPVSMQIADSGLSLIKSTNLEPEYLVSDAPGMRSYRANIFGGS